MFSYRSCALVLLVVAATSSLSACTGRMLLRGMHGNRKTSQTAAATPNQFNVYFVKSKAASLQVTAVSRRVINRGDRLEQAVRELLDGPTSVEERAGLGTEIPRGTILLAVKRSGKDVELDLSRRFALSGGTTSFETRLEQLRRTVSQVCGQADVYLSVEGKRLNIEEGEGIEIHQPINR